MTAPVSHLKAVRTDRGFLWMPALADSYSENPVRVIESSAASGPHIWLRAGESTQAHLTAEQAWQLKEQIEYLLAHHHHGDARPKDES